MSGAQWSTAERKSRLWRIWPLRWPTIGRAQVVSRPEKPECPLVLLGTFVDPDAFIRASEALRAAAFSDDELACICGKSDHGTGGVWRKIRNWLKPSPGAPPGASAGSIQVGAWPYLQTLLASGGGFIIVWSAARLYQACHIIEQAGGQVGTVP